MTKTTAAAKTLLTGNHIHTPSSFRVAGDLVTGVEVDSEGVRVMTDNGFFHFSEDFQVTVTR